MWFIFVSIAICLVLGLFGVMFSAGENDCSMTKEVYECGMEPMVVGKTFFYLHFFPVGVLFLLFDVELIVCLPIVGMVFFSMKWEIVWMMIMMILSIGLILEVNSGTLDWKE